MKYLTAQLGADTYAIAVDDHDTWGDTPSYMNLYIIKRGKQTIVIDAGMKKYRPIIVDELAKIGIAPEAVTHLLITHGHIDHAAGSGLFPSAKKFIHPQDLGFLPPAVAAQFAPYEALQGNSYLSAGDLEGFEVIHVNTHTPGSVAIYDRASRALYVGDFFCFFGEALPEGALVSYSPFARDGSCQYVAEQKRSGDPSLPFFIAGLGRLLGYQPEYFCTGHGVILQGDIQDFLKRLWESGNRA